MEVKHVECGGWKVEEEKGLLWLVQEMRFMVSRDLSVMICERKSASLQCYTPPVWSWATIFQKSNNSPEEKATRFTGCMPTWVEEYKLSIALREKMITAAEFKEISGEWSWVQLKENKHALNKQMLSEMQERFFE